MSRYFSVRISKPTQNYLNHIQRRFMPVNVPPTATGKRRFRLAVETDPHKLVNYCCGLNYHIDEPPIKLKPDNEYPDWLWKLRLGPKPHSWELEKGTKEYYIALGKEGQDRNYKLKMSKEPTKKVVGKTMLERQEFKHHIRFAALAHMEDDPGLPTDTIGADLHQYYRHQLVARDYYMPVRDRVLYADKVETNLKYKNYHYDPEDTFKPLPKSVVPRPPIERKAFQNSIQRHRYAVN